MKTDRLSDLEKVNPMLTQSMAQSTYRQSVSRSVLNQRITQKNANDLYESLRNLSPRTSQNNFNTIRSMNAQ